MIEIDYSLAKTCKNDKNAVGFYRPLNIAHIPYGTPKRLKITQPNQADNPDIAYLLHSKDPDAKLPDNAHPWSRVTYDAEKRDTQRVTPEEAKKIDSLADLFKAIDPKVSKRVLGKVDTMESEIGTTSHKKINLVVSEVEISGCILFENDNVLFNINDLNSGLTGIRGSNGSGKSSLLSFCSPYPVIIGKDTNSGRQSAIKDFFSKPDSYIKKTVFLNGSKHEHIITIRGAHTKNPKTECYLNVEGIPKLEKGTFDEMLQACEDLYGPIKDYILTSFYIQPLQSKDGISLMSASMTDIRNLVQSIAGVNRDAEKQCALDKVSEIKKEIEKLNNWLSGVSEFQIDIE